MSINAVSCYGIRAFLADDAGQDMVEYAFAAAFIGIVGVGILDAIGSDILTAFTNWLDPSTGVPSKWDPPSCPQAGCP
jgi:Flp pilus assembly pilin Flp